MQKTIFNIIMPLFLFVGIQPFAQTSNTENSTIQESSNDEVMEQLEVVYGSYYQTLILEQPGAIEFYTDFYNRCEFIPLEEAPSNIKNISTLGLKEKYNPEEISHDPINTFVQSEFIVLKYQFNFYNKTDLYYKIYNTDTVLKINKLSQ